MTKSPPIPLTMRISSSSSSLSLNSILARGQDQDQEQDAYSYSSTQPLVSIIAMASSNNDDMFDTPSLVSASTSASTSVPVSVYVPASGKSSRIGLLRRPSRPKPRRKKILSIGDVEAVTIPTSTPPPLSSLAVLPSYQRDCDYEQEDQHDDVDCFDVSRRSTTTTNYRPILSMPLSTPTMPTIASTQSSSSSSTSSSSDNNILPTKKKKKLPSKLFFGRQLRQIKKRLFFESAASSSSSSSSSQEEEEERTSTTTTTMSLAPRVDRMFQEEE
eukprot:CAMPEP_0170795240 /NCGR_PEP_ID=MMETSP0733-20121128/23997_1 /TAXON_ID=186038 /ORGANISM="Fragilariopsis kerguelensis, Strain L26-C5" /LENGTH=272 /DNA_ID=CAMNT_0011145073 /DNA_START=71 /DNA_END=886 /DNA_ORIENTATION=+